jgi:hypothetical protein
VIFFGKLVHSAQRSAFLRNQILKENGTGSDDVTKWDKKCRRDQ